MFPPDLSVLRNLPPRWRVRLNRFSGKKSVTPLRRCRSENRWPSTRALIDPCSHEIDVPPGERRGFLGHARVRVGVRDRAVEEAVRAVPGQYGGPRFASPKDGVLRV